MTYSFDLLFIKSNKKELIAPIAKIYVKTFTRDKSGKVFITPNCFTLKEIELKRADFRNKFFELDKDDQDRLHYLEYMQ